jgi:Amt family ammonium transporter
VIVVLVALFLDRIKVDDPVGAFPVHGVNGIWGTLSIGLFGRQALGVAQDGLFYGGGFAQLGVQALGAVAVTAFVLVSMGLIFILIDKTVGLRVTTEEEHRGLDIGEHGLESYGGFQIID